MLGRKRTTGPGILDGKGVRRGRRRPGGGSGALDVAVSDKGTEATEGKMAESDSTLRDVPMEILCLSVTPPVIRKGRVSREGEGPCEVVLEEPEPRLEPGMRVVLDGGPDHPYRIKGKVTASDGCRLRVETERVVPPDKRSFPRMYGGIRLRYRPLGPGEAESLGATWLAGGEVQGGEWREPDPFMDFSSTGLRFEDRPGCRPGDLLLMELKIPDTEERWRAAARVVRVEEARAEEDETPAEAPQARVAVQFVEIPPEAAKALTAFALKIQHSLLKA